ncbi:TIGR04255 family protein [Methylobacterium sp. C33D]
MKFPETDRVIYDNNPLAQVICQIRFPRILAIDDRIPADFQHSLGDQYPFVETKEVVHINFGETNQTKRTHYDFITEDKKYKVSLSSDAISIDTASYERWEVFSRHVDHAIRCLSKVYSVPVFTRIGLRYIDIISREKLGLKDLRWSDLIISSALGLLHEDAVPVEDVLELGAAYLFKIGEVDKLTLRTGLGRSDKTKDEIIFVVDGDFFRDEPVKGIDDTLSVLRDFNKSAGSAFRWIIQQRLHDALGPKPAV